MWVTFCSILHTAIRKHYIKHSLKDCLQNEIPGYHLIALVRSEDLSIGFLNDPFLMRDASTDTTM